MKRSESQCACGAALPVHFIEIADDRFAHVCACERRYVVKEGVFVEDGTQVNPFARYDAAHGKGSA